MSSIGDLAADSARLLFQQDPVLGDHPAQMSVDAFVERAAEALLAVATAGQAHGIPEQSEHPGAPNP